MDYKLDCIERRLVSEPAEWTNTFRLLTTVKDDDEVDAGEDSVVIVLHDSTEQLQDSGIVETTAAESKRRRWREMPQHLRSSIDGSGHSSSVASMPGRGPRPPRGIPRGVVETSIFLQLPRSPAEQHCNSFRTS